MDSILFWAFAAAFNPTLLAATTVMLLLDHPKRLLLGYLAGAALTSVTLGMVIVFALDGSSGATSTTQSTLSPAADLALGGILVVVAYVIRPGRAAREEGRLADRRRRRAQAKKEKGPPKWQQYLSRGSARDTFVVGVLLTLPGASYLIGLGDIADRDASTVATIAMVLGFNLIMLIALELPLISFTVAPEWTPDAIARFKAYFNRNSKKFAFRLAAGAGLLLIVRGVIELL
jgi:Sap, sulfolipid-1-addressing protein